MNARIHNPSNAGPMRAPKHCQSLLCLVLILLGCVANPAAAQDDAVQVRQVSERGTDVRGGLATTVVDAPIDRVRSLVTDYAGYNGLLPNFRASRVLAQRGNRALVYIQVSIMRNTATLWAQMQVRTRKDGDVETIEGRMQEGNMDHFLARWVLTPVSPTQTKIEFTLLAAPQLTVPDSLVSAENEKFAKKCLRAVRERLSGAR